MSKVIQKAPKKPARKIYPLMTPEERLVVWRGAKGIWKNRGKEMIREHKKIRAGLDRKLPSTR